MQSTRTWKVRRGFFVRFFSASQPFFLFFGLFQGGVQVGFGYSTSNVALSRIVDGTETTSGRAIPVVVTFENLVPSALRGFYFADHIPQGLFVETVSVLLEGEMISTYLYESGSVGAVYPETSVSRWFLETPTEFLQENEVLQDASVEITYFLSATEEGIFDLDEFHWVGYFEGGVGAAFGYSEEEDRETIVFHPAIQIITADFPVGSLNTHYSLEVEATGGVPPYNWAIDSGALPSGLTLHPSTGVISGVPVSAGDFVCTIRCSDSGAIASSVTREYDMRIEAVSSVKNWPFLR